MIDSDARDIYEFEKKISMVGFPSVDLVICVDLSFFKYHWTAAEQRARQK